MPLPHRAASNGANVLSSASVRLARVVALSYHFSAIMDGDQSGQSGRQETDGRSTPQSEGHCLPGADRWGESSENKCRLKEPSTAASTHTQTTFLDVTS